MRYHGEVPSTRGVEVDFVGGAFDAPRDHVYFNPPRISSSCLLTTLPIDQANHSCEEVEWEGLEVILKTYLSIRASPMPFHAFLPASS